MRVIIGKANDEPATTCHERTAIVYLSVHSDLEDLTWNLMEIRVRRRNRFI